MTKSVLTFMFFLWFFACIDSTRAGVTFDWASVANPGNDNDTHNNGNGGVDYSYRISKHEVENAQYTEFLNAVASTDTYELYSKFMGINAIGGITRSGSSGNYTYAVKDDAIGQGPGGSNYTYANKPVVYVSFLDAMRFVNWLHNGQPIGTQNANTTESGVYTVSDGVSEVRSSTATYFIPSEDEWYKAAYHKNDGVTSNYWDYTTSTDSISNNNLPIADTGNSANFFDGATTTGSFQYALTDVGAYKLSESPYGTFDQGGNVAEWNEAVSFDRSERGVRGSTYSDISIFISASRRLELEPYLDVGWVGFRIGSTIPEPTTLFLALAAILAPLPRRCIKR